jgi:hypothetical protein
MATLRLLDAQEAPHTSNDLIDLLRQIADRLDAKLVDRVDQFEDGNRSSERVTLTIVDQRSGVAARRRVVF